MSAGLDVGGAVRIGEEVDLLRLDAWLKHLRPEITGEPVLTQFTGGASNWTYRLQYGSNPQTDFILRRPPAGTKAKSAHDMGREFKVQSALNVAYPYVPEMIGLCQDESVLGCEFYVMRRIEGYIPRKNLPKGLMLERAQVRELCINALDRLLDLHRVDIQTAGLTSLGKGAGYCRRQIEGWSERYLKARTWNTPSYHYVRAWLKDHTPDDVGACVIHNDWRFDNLVLNAQAPTHVIGVLDWEMATLGDPLMDLGCALAYWVQADDGYFMQTTRRQITHLPGMLTRQEVIEYYLARSDYGRHVSLKDFAFYEVYGLFRLAVILQQIYYRYHHKQTTNAAFKNFWFMINYFDWRCRRIIRCSARQTD